MADPYASHQKGLESPADNAVAVTPADSDLATVARAVFVGTGGDVSIRPANSSTDVVFKNVASGAVLPIRAKRVNATNTTAEDIVALY